MSMLYFMFYFITFYTFLKFLLVLLFVSLCLLFPFLFFPFDSFFLHSFTSLSLTLFSHSSFYFLYFPSHCLCFLLFSFCSLSPFHFLSHYPHFPSFSSLFLFSSPLSLSSLFPLFPFLSSRLTELGQESVPSSTHNATVVVSAAGVPYLQARAGGGEQNTTLSISTTPSASLSSSSSTSCNRQPAPPGIMASAHPQGQSYSLGISNSGLGPPPPNPPGGVYTSTGQHNSSDGCSLASMVSAANTDPHTHRHNMHLTLILFPSEYLCVIIFVWIFLVDTKSTVLTFDFWLCANTCFILLLSIFKHSQCNLFWTVGLTTLRSDNANLSSLHHYNDKGCRFFAQNSLKQSVVDIRGSEKSSSSFLNANLWFCWMKQWGSLAYYSSCS